MHLLKTITALVAAVSSVAADTLVPALEKRASPGGGTCTSKYFAPVTQVGNKAGTPFCESKFGTTYLPITGITTWSDSSYVYGIQATYSDGSLSPVYGYTTGKNQLSISLNYASDNFTVLNIYQTAGYPYINALYAVTRTGKSMNAGESIFFFPTQYTQAVASGILFGISGTIDPATGYLFSLGFEFLNGTIDSIDLRDFRFANLPVDDEDITPTTIDTATYINNQSSSSEMWTFAGSNSTMVTYTFTLSFTEAFMPSEAIEFGFDGLIPGVNAKSTTQFQWNLESMQGFMYAYATTAEFMWSQTGSVGPHTAVSCVAAYGRGVGNFPFNSTVVVTLRTGDVFSFKENGVLKVNDASNVEIECSDNNE